MLSRMKSTIKLPDIVDYMLDLTQVLLDSRMDNAGLTASEIRVEYSLVILLHR